MSNPRQNPLTRGPNPYPNGSRPSNVVEFKVAANPRRQGQRQADEGLATEEALIARRFLTGIGQDSYAPVGDRTGRAPTSYARQVVSGERGVIASRNPGPTWDAVDRAELAAFVQGDATGGSEAGQATPYPFAVRPHAVGRGIRARSQDGLARGERQNTSYASKTGVNPRTRPNPATVTE